MSALPPPADNWLGYSPAPRRAGFGCGAVALIAIVSFVLGALATGGVMLAIGAAVLYRAGGFEQVKDIEIACVSPSEVVSGELFTIELTVRNTGAEAQSVVGLDLYDELGGGFELVSSDPPWRRIEADNGRYGFETVLYNEQIPPGREVRIVLTARAGTPGEYSGDLDICINESMAWLTEVVSLRVTRATPERRF